MAPTVVVLVLPVSPSMAVIQSFEVKRQLGGTGLISEEPFRAAPPFDQVRAGHAKIAAKRCQPLDLRWEHQVLDAAGTASTQTQLGRMCFCEYS